MASVNAADMPLCGNELHIRAQPSTQRFDGVRLLLQLFRQIGKLLHLAAVHRFEQGFARGEVPVKRADATPAARATASRPVRAAGAENRLCRLEHTLAIANGIGVRLSRSSSDSRTPRAPRMGA